MFDQIIEWLEDASHGEKHGYSARDVQTAVAALYYHMISVDGIVKLIHTGSDMGTLIVLQHHLGGKALVNSVYMHGGDTVFVKAGQRVTCGQLLGTMGSGMQVALYTTLSGLGCALLVSIQCQWLDRCADSLVSKIIELGMQTPDN